METVIDRVLENMKLMGFELSSPSFGAIVLIIIYFFPWVLAKIRRATGSGGVFVVNLFFGWTIVGWIVALAWAAGGRVEERTETPPNKS
jgi:hypothetical protein